LQSTQHDPKSAEPLPPRGGAGRLHLDANGGGLGRRRARRAPPHHTAVAEEAAADGPEEVRGEDDPGGDVRVQQVRPRERPDVVRGAGVPEALLLLPQEPGRHHGRLRVQVRSRCQASG